MLIKIKIKFLCNKNFSMQITARLRKELLASNLQLIREYTFNTGSEAMEAVELLKVSEYYLVATKH